MLTPRQVADRLDDRFRLLTTGARTALPRQQTLRAVVDWSWELLSPGERELLAVCGVFVGGAALEDLEGVSGLDGLDALDRIDRLVSKSLVLAEPAPAPEGVDLGMRYRLLETIREYALERLAEQGSEQEIRTRHAHHFARLAERADPELRGPGQVAWMHRLDAAEDNLRAALNRSLDTEDVACGLRLANGLGWYGLMRGKRFGRNHSPRVVALADRLGVPHDAVYLRRVLTYNALHAFELDVPLEEATAQLERALRLARAGEWRDSLYSLAEIGAALFIEMDGLDLVFERECRSGWPRPGTPAGTRRGADVPRQDPARRGTPREAEELTAWALADFQRLGDQWGIANCGQTMAMLESQRGAHHEALAAIEAVLPATRLIGSTSDEVMLLVMAATEYDSLGEPEQATRVLEQAREQAGGAAESHANIYLMTYECVRARRSGRLDQAQLWLDEVTRAAGQSFLGPVQALLAIQQACITIGRGYIDGAERHLRTALEYSLAFHYDRADVGAALEARAALEFARSEPRRAAWLHGLHAVVRGRRLPASATPDLAQTALEVRAELGGQAYDAAFEEGRAVDPAVATEVCREVFGAAPQTVPGWWHPGRGLRHAQE